MNDQNQTTPVQTEPIYQNPAQSQSTYSPQTSPINQTAAQTPPPELFNNNSHKKLAIIIGLLVIILIGIGAYVFGQNSASKLTEKNNINKVVSKPTATPTPNPTTNWKTYAGNLFTFKYPSNWFVNKYSNYSSVNNAVEISDVKNSPTAIIGTSKTNTRIGITYYNKVTPSSFPEQNGVSQNPTIKQYAINGYSGIRGDMSGEGGNADNIFLTSPNGGYVQIILLKPMENANASEIYFDQLLSTFKFINNPTQQISPTSKIIPTPQITQSEVNSKIISDISKELGTNYKNITVSTIDKIGYARGNANFTASGGGIMYFAINNGASWSIIWQGNEAPGCSKFLRYANFPKDWCDQAL